MYKVLFICSSNVCRSPYCEFMFRRMVEADEVTKGRVQVSSAAVVNRVKSLFPKAAVCLKNEGFSDEELSAFSPCYKRDGIERFEEADVIIGMSRAHGIFTPSKYRHKYITLSEAAGWEYSALPDPYTARTQEIYDKAMGKIKSYLEQYFQRLRSELSK